LLYSQRREAGIHVFPELRMRVAPRRYRVPDIAITRRKGNCSSASRPFSASKFSRPEIARIESRIADYLAFGVPYVWMIELPCRGNVSG
jgi:Uma2 family endonuclease